MSADIDQILERLAKDVEAAVHSLYRGEMRSNTAKARTGHLIQDARAKVANALGAAADAVAGGESPKRPTPVATSSRPSVSAPMVAGAAHGWTKEDSDAVMKCITAWLPIGGPNTTAPDTTCIAAGKMLVPTWGERERAREAVKSIMQ
ncbi:MAG TPA: hypothetical protein VGQ30_03855 [Gemmatimonadaceae bacterium]|jgi:hypothetical protein|nr:hypothetical protein [Gemmatimonadaceae bacterium]